MKTRRSYYNVEVFCEDCYIPLINAESHRAWHECMVIFERIDANHENRSKE